MHRTSARRAERGMTLLDCLIAIGLLTIGAAGLLAMELVAMGASLQARHLEQATRLAEERMESVSYATTAPAAGGDTVDGSGCPGVRCQQVGQLFQRAWTVNAGTGAIRVSVAWVDGEGRTHTVALDGLR